MTATAQAWLDSHVGRRSQAFIRVLAVLIPTGVWWWVCDVRELSIVAHVGGTVGFLALAALVLWA